MHAWFGDYVRPWDLNTPWYWIFMSGFHKKAELWKPYHQWGYGERHSKIIFDGCLANMISSFKS